MEGYEVAGYGGRAKGFADENVENEEKKGIRMTPRSLP